MARNNGMYQAAEELLHSYSFYIFQRMERLRRRIANILGLGKKRSLEPTDEELDPRLSCSLEVWAAVREIKQKIMKL